MRDIMVDEETTGLQANRHGIIQLAAVRFDIVTGEVDPNFFDRCLTLPNHLSWDEETRNWWLRDKAPLLNKILARGEDPKTVLTDFQQWVTKGGESVRFWSKPSHFDFPLLEGYFKDFGVLSPFHHNETIDMNSYMRGLAKSQEKLTLDRDTPFVGEAHNAIHDTLHQVKVLLKAEETYGANSSNTG